MFSTLYMCSAHEQKSFFLEDDESKMVLETLRGEKTTITENSNKHLKLSGIFFIDENNWTVWVNDQAYSSIGQQKDFSIDEVSENGVFLSLPDGKTIFLSVSIE